MNCKSCGKEIVGAGLFCQSCGARVEPESPQYAEQPPQYAPQAYNQSGFAYAGNAPAVKPQANPTGWLLQTIATSWLLSYFAFRVLFARTMGEYAVSSMFPVFGLILAVNLLVAIVALVVWHTGGRRLASNAAEAYQKIYDEMYEATNDFLVTHGYEPIGFIQGYAMSTIREAPWR